MTMDLSRIDHDREMRQSVRPEGSSTQPRLAGAAAGRGHMSAVLSCSLTHCANSKLAQADLLESSPDSHCHAQSPKFASTVFKV